MRITGTNGNGTITGNAPTGDNLSGAGGNDRLFGLAGDDETDGGAGNDTLDGSTDVDRFFGFPGNDTYIVDNAYDNIVENGGRGTDQLLTSVTYTLSGNIENGRITGIAARNLTGNEAHNLLERNTAANRLSGLGWVDRIDGGKGADVLTGSLGRDVFFFALGDDADRITDFDATAGDRIDLWDMRSIRNFADLKASHMEKSGANVVLGAGGGDVITLVGVKLADLGASDFIF